MSTAAPTAKRDAILREAVRLFAERGYAGTEMDAIGAAAGVAKGTLYRYFANKEELFRAAVAAAFAGLVEHVFETIACLDDPVAIIRTSFRALARYCQKHPEVLDLSAQERAANPTAPARTHLLYRSENNGYFAEVVRRGIAAGQFREIDPVFAVNAFAYMMYGLLFASRTEGRLADLVTRADQACDLLLAGLMNPARPAC
ncbi:MAG: TetR/AcrR family transcriptional regulator [Pirellulales bacterium]|nr:TetR/AcrR family transcriptional regulator [Pirellulales bacterium]